MAEEHAHAAERGTSPKHRQDLKRFRKASDDVRSEAVPKSDGGQSLGGDTDAAPAPHQGLHQHDQVKENANENEATGPPNSSGISSGDA
jgi:hypothetical protein